MKKILINAIMLAVTALVLSSCEKGFNDWDVDPSHARLFRSLNFETTRIGATDVEIGYTQTVSADKYIFEFSKDSLEFNEIVKTEEVLADTLTPFAPSTIPARVAYRTQFEGLDGLSGYSVRMKGVDTETGDESKYVELFFRTTAEQLFTSVDIAVNSLTLHWPANEKVTRVIIVDTLSNEPGRAITLNESHTSNGSIKIDDLNPGTVYRVVIFNDDVQRGLMDIRTSGLKDGEIIPVSPGDDIPALVEPAVSAGKTNIILMFAGGQTYNLEEVSLPTGLTNVSVTGEPDANGEKPQLNIGSFKLGDTEFGQVIFENVNIQATSDASFLITQEANGSEVESYSFINCRIEGYGNGVVRLNNAVAVGKIDFNNCFVHKNGGWGVVNVGGSTAEVDSITFQNSTLTDLSTQLMDVRVAVKKIAVENCTFYNQNASMTQLLRFDTNGLPLTFVGSNNIIAGTNNGAPINATSHDHANFGLAVSFAGSYRTNELEIERASRDFADITVFNGTADDLFVDPAQGDFRIKPNNGFGGRGTAGDPRWFE